MESRLTPGPGHPVSSRTADSGTGRVLADPVGEATRRLTAALLPLGTWWRTLLATGTGILAAAVVGHISGHALAAGPSWALMAAVTVSFGAMGPLVLASVRGHPVGRLMTLAGVVAGAELIALSWGRWLPLGWLAQWLWWPPFGLVFLAVLLFPDGRLPGRRWRPLAIVIAAATGVAAVAFALAALDHPQSLLTSLTPPLTERAQRLVQVAVAAMAVTLLSLVGVVGALVRRWRRADDIGRRQLACLVLGTLNVPGAGPLATTAVPAAMTVAILRHHLYDLDWVINRTTVWLVMTLLVVAGFTATVAVLEAAVLDGGTRIGSLVATGLIGVTFQPLRQRVQRAIDRLLYGSRGDPYQVIAELGALAGRTADVTALPSLLARILARSLRVPYVAVELDGGDGPPRVLAEHGRASTPVATFPMLSRGLVTGRLRVGVRSPGGRFTRRERELLDDAASQVALAVEAARLAQSIQESRERLVLAREDERQRLRRDVHDGVSSALAGMSLHVAAVRRLVWREPGPDRMLATIATDLDVCRAEIRRLVDQLRPPALDQGLEAALHAECARWAATGLTVRLRVEDDVTGLPAAVEVASYRILSEALANVARHASAGSCDVLVRRQAMLALDVVDDGCGPPTVGASSGPGVGLASMRERAAELGGRCDVGPADPRGTAVRLRLPIPVLPPGTGADARPASLAGR
jgi:two-component system NarL family sensor kinase